MDPRDLPAPEHGTARIAQTAANEIAIVAPLREELASVDAVFDLELPPEELLAIRAIQGANLDDAVASAQFRLESPKRSQ